MKDNMSDPITASRWMTLRQNPPPIIDDKGTKEVIPLFFLFGSCSQ